MDWVAAKRILLISILESHAVICYLLFLNKAFYLELWNTQIYCVMWQWLRTYLKCTCFTNTNICLLRLGNYKKTRVYHLFQFHIGNGNLIFGYLTASVMYWLACSLRCGRSGIGAPVGSNQRLCMCFSAKDAVLRRKCKDWLSQNQNVSEWIHMSTCGLMFQWASTKTIQISVLV